LRKWGRCPQLYGGQDNCSCSHRYNAMYRHLWRDLGPLDRSRYEAVIERFTQRSARPLTSTDFGFTSFQSCAECLASSGSAQTRAPNLATFPWTLNFVRCLMCVQESWERLRTNQGQPSSVNCRLRTEQPGQSPNGCVARIALPYIKITAAAWTKRQKRASGVGRGLEPVLSQPRTMRRSELPK
jgi:hypothetical protein